MLYHPNGIPMWDAWAIEKDGEYHLFHLQAGDPTNPWGHAVSTDMIHWREQPSVLPPTGTLHDVLPHFTGCTFENEGKYYTYYTMRAANGDQCIGLATSDDLYTWIDHPDNPVLDLDSNLFITERPPNSNWLNTDCRDMLVVRAPDGTFCGYFAAVENSEERRGAIGMARSRDLIHWTDQTIVYRTPGIAMVEMPEVFEWNGRYVLTMLSGINYGFQRPSNVRGAARSTIYAFSDDLAGPFVEDKEANLLLGGPTDSGFSCRTIEIGGIRRAIYVCPNHGDSSVSIPKNVVADKKGHPTLTYAVDLLANVHREALSIAPVHVPPVAFAWDVYGGQWKMIGNCVVGETKENSWQAALLDTRSVGGAHNWEIRARFTGDCRACGFVCYETGADGTPNPYFFGSGRRLAITVQPKDGIVAVSTIYEGDILTQRAITPDADAFSLRVIKVDNVLEIYVNDALMLNLGADLPKFSMPGYFVDDGHVTLSEIEAFKWED